jgi:hypothetical protein
MVGKFISQSEAEAEGRTVRTVQVNARNLRLFPAVTCKGRHGERIAWQDENRSVTLVEPFRLHPFLIGLGLSAFFAHQEHAHAVGGMSCRRGLVHLIAPFGRPEMRQARAAYHQMRWVRMINRWQDGHSFK